MTFISALASMGVTTALTSALGTTAGTIAAGALAGSATGATLGGIGSAITGGDIGEGMGMGALTGAVGGGLAGGLGTMASPAAQAAATGTQVVGEGAKLAAPAMTSVVPQNVALNLGGGAASAAPAMTSVAPQQIAANLGSGINAAPMAAPSFSESIGNFALNNPTLTSTALSLPVSMALSPSGSNGEADLEATNQEDRKRFLSYLGNYRPSLAPGYATGGITDLDSYMSNAQNIPNPQEVANPEGYNRGSVQMLAGGGIADLGGYATGGIPNLLQGPGDGVSDDIPASIAGKQPARLASGEYVVPSRIVSELGNGSTDAGAKRLDTMVQKVNAGRAKTLGGKKYATDTRAYMHLPA